MNMSSARWRFLATLSFALFASTAAFGAQAKCNIADGPIKYGKCLDAKAKAAAKRAKKAADKAAAAAKKAAAAAKNKGGKAAADAKAAADKAAAEAKAAADKVVAEVKAATSDVVKRRVCIDTVTAINQGKVLGYMDATLAEAKKKQRQLQAKFKNAGDRSRLLKKVNALLLDMKDSFPELKRIQKEVNSTKALARLFRDADLICSGDVKKINNYLARNGLKPKLPQLKAEAPSLLDSIIPSAHAYYSPRSHFFAGYHIGLTLGLVGGATGTFSWTTDFINMGALTFTLAPGFMSDATLVLADGLTFYWKADPEDFAVNGWQISGTLGVATPEVKVGVAAEIPLAPEERNSYFGPPVGVGPTRMAGVGLDPLVLELGIGYTWTIWAPEWAASRAGR